MVASTVGVNLRRPAEFSDGHDQRLAKQAAVGEVVQERGESDIEDRAQHVLKAVGVLGMSVPKGVGDGFIAGISRPVDVNQPRPGFDQASSQNERLAPLVQPEAFSCASGFPMR